MLNLSCFFFTQFLMHSDIAYALIEYTHICEQVIALLRILILRAYISLYGNKSDQSKSVIFFNVLLVRWFLGYSHLFFLKKMIIYCWFLIVQQLFLAYTTLINMFSDMIMIFLKKRSTTPWYARHFFLFVQRQFE